MHIHNSHSFTSKLKKFRIIFVAFSLLSLGIFQSTVHAANVLWVESFIDSDGDYGTGLYADIESLGLGITDAAPDTMVALIQPYYDTSLTFFSSGGSGAVFFDTNQDSVRDIWAYAPSAVMSAFSKATREVFRGTSGSLAATGCYSSWYLSTDYTYYMVDIPWRCLGAPTALTVEAWLSNSFGFDFLTGGRTVNPVSLPATTTTTTSTTTTTTTTTTTVPPTTTTVYVPPTTVYVPPPATLPLAAAANMSTPGLIDNWVDYLIVKKSVSITAVLNSTNCCYGVKTGTRVMTVLPKSAAFCRVQAKRLYGLKKGSCSVKVTAGTGKKAKSETLKFSVKLK